MDTGRRSPSATIRAFTSSDADSPRPDSTAGRTARRRCETLCGRDESEALHEARTRGSALAPTGRIHGPRTGRRARIQPAIDRDTAVRIAPAATRPIQRRIEGDTAVRMLHSNRHAAGAVPLAGEWNRCRRIH